VLEAGVAGPGVVDGQLGVAQAQLGHGRHQRRVVGHRAVLGQLDDHPGQGRGGGQGPLDRLGDQVVGVQVDGQEAVRGQLRAQPDDPFEDPGVQLGAEPEPARGLEPDVGPGVGRPGEVPGT
jgi:hypothetical protein